MKSLNNLSIRLRLHLGASVVMLAFFCLTGVAVQGIYSQHLRDSHFTRLQSAVYLLIAMTELNPQGQLVLPKSLALANGQNCKNYTFSRARRSAAFSNPA